MELLKRIAKALIEKSDNLPVARLEYYPPDDPIAIGAEFLIRQKRMRAKVINGLTPGLPVIRNADEFRPFVEKVIIDCLQNGWRDFPFFLWSIRSDELMGWREWKSLEKGCGMMGTAPLLTRGPDLYVRGPQDFFLCTLQIVMGKG